jgi:hypothetical protein
MAPAPSQGAGHASTSRQPRGIRGNARESRGVVVDREARRRRLSVDTTAARDDAVRVDDEDDAPAVMAIEDSIDLHHFAPRDIPSVVAEYLEAAARKGYREVRIIHGRGKGVQRERVRELLAGHRLVLSFATPVRGRGGIGGTIAWLRTVDAAGRMRARWERSAEAPAWRKLIAWAWPHADFVRFAVSARGARSWRIGAPFPFVHRHAAPDGDVVLDRLARDLGPATQRLARGGRTFVSYGCSAEVRAYLDRHALDEWTQLEGRPEDPSLLGAAGAVLETSAGEVVLWLTAEEEAELAAAGIDCVPT